jgi:hypothetical protein
MNVREIHIGPHRPRRPSSRPVVQYGLVWLILVVVLSGPFAQEGKKGPTASPQLEFETRELDLGSVDRGQVVTARFSARNVGDQPVRILRVKPG